MYSAYIRSMRNPDRSSSRSTGRFRWQPPVNGSRTTLTTCRAMLDEEQPARRPQHPPHLLKRSHDVRDRTKRPRDNNRINTLTAQRDVFARSLEERHRVRRLTSREPRHRQCSRGRFESNQRRRGRVERHIEPRAKPDLQHAALGLRDESLPVRQESLLSHPRMNQTGQDGALVEAHDKQYLARTTKMIMCSRSWLLA